MLDLESIINNIFFTITNNPFIVTYGLWGVFIVVILPFTFIPKIVLVTPFLSAGYSPFSILLILSIGGFIREMIVYYFAKTIYLKMKKNPVEEARAEHFFHQYGEIIFFIIPFIYGVGDFIMIYAGIKRVSLIKMTPGLMLGQIVSAIVSITATMYLIKIPI